MYFDGSYRFEPGVHVADAVTCGSPMVHATSRRRPLPVDQAFGRLLQHPPYAIERIVLCAALPEGVASAIFGGIGATDALLGGRRGTM